MSMMQENGGWKLVFPQDSHSEENFLSVTFSGKYSILDGDYDPLLVVTTKSFDPMEEGLDSDKVLFTIKGRSHIGNGHAVWIFKGKGSVCNQHDLRLYLYRQNTVEEYEYVRLNDTDDVNFLHFYWQPYYLFHTEERKELHMVLNSNSFNESFIGQSLSNNLFFVYIECDGCPAPDTPCRLCSMTTLGVTFDEALLYQRVMQYTKELTQECHIPGGFTDFILLWNAFKASIETEHYIPAIKYYNMLFGKDSTDKLYGPQGVSTRVSYKGCGCNG